MLLTITHTSEDAEGLGYLLHKHPGKVQDFSLPIGRALVFYPEASATLCTACLLLEVDPIGLSRGKGRLADAGRPLQPYVNDRPYVASSFMSVAIAKVFGSAMAGRCKDRPELVDRALDLCATLSVVPARAGGEPLIRELFEPLGYDVKVARHPLDPAFPDWGEGIYYTVTLTGTKRLSELLTHLYVLIPVLDNDKHYWIGEDEVQKLLSRGAGWLGDHPAKELITSRYLKRYRALTREALSRLTPEEEPDEADETDGPRPNIEQEIERPLSLNDQRHAAVVAALKASGARRVLDLGCAQGKLLRSLLDEPQFDRVVGMDVSLRALEIAERRLKPERMPDRQRERLRLLHGSLMYRDRRLAGYDAACLVEVIEHLDPPRLAAMERSVFEFAAPQTVVVTTPNIEYNVRFETLEAGKLRHTDHRFEWTRQEFEAWATRVAERFGYAARFLPIGEDDPEVGSPTQMAVFTRENTGKTTAQDTTEGDA